MEFKQHYSVDAFGVSDIDRSTKGVRVLDLIRWRMTHPARLPLQEAAAEVIDKLESLGDRLQLFASTRTGWPVPTAAYRWQTRAVREVDPFYDGLAHRRGGSLLDPNRPRRVSYVVKNEEPWTVCLRRNLVERPQPKLMEAGAFVPLVIAHAVAEELFATESRQESGELAMPSDAEGLAFEAMPVDQSLWGEWKTEDAHLVAVPSLAYMVAFAHCNPINPSIRQVLSALEASPEVSLFVTCRDDFARLVESEQGWPGVQAKGRAGLLLLLHQRWLNRRGKPFDEYLASIDGGQVAVCYDDALRMFRAEFGAMKRGAERSEGGASAGGLAQASLVALPGSVEPTTDAPGAGDEIQSGKQAALQMLKSRKRNSKWLDEHRAAVDELRSLGVTETDIAAAAGVERARLHQIFGSREEYEQSRSGFGRTVEALQRKA